MTKEIRKRVRKDRLDFRIKNLEEELWYDIKKAKSGFIPTHTKLRDKDLDKKGA